MCGEARTVDVLDCGGGGMEEVRGMFLTLFGCGMEEKWCNFVWRSLRGELRTV